MLLSTQALLNSKHVAIDLFAGCGGMSMGMENAGFAIAYANEMLEHPALTYSTNFPSTEVEIADIRKTDPVQVSKKIGRKKVDVIAAGPPCQGFSTLGLRDENDGRNRLFKQIIKFVEFFQPKFVVMENVVGLLSMKKGKTIRSVCQKFEKCGYSVSYDTLVASDFGVPQNRTRVFVICSKKNIPKEELFPKPNGHAKISAEEAISDLAFLGVGSSSVKYLTKPQSDYQKLMRHKTRKLNNHHSPKHSRKIQERFSSIPNGTSAHKLDSYDSDKRDCYKMDPLLPCRTISTLPEDIVHYSRNRIPTVRELARLQSFPDSFIFLGPRTTGGLRRRFECPQYTQVGNAVPPMLAEAVFRHIRELM